MLEGNASFVFKEMGRVPGGRAIVTISAWIVNSLHTQQCM